MTGTIRRPGIGRRRGEGGAAVYAPASEGARVWGKVNKDGTAGTPHKGFSVRRTGTSGANYRYYVTYDTPFTATPFVLLSYNANGRTFHQMDKNGFSVQFWIGNSRGVEIDFEFVVFQL